MFVREPNKLFVLNNNFILYKLKFYFKQINNLLNSDETNIFLFYLNKQLFWVCHSNIHINIQ